MNSKSLYILTLGVIIIFSCKGRGRYTKEQKLLENYLQQIGESEKLKEDFCYVLVNSESCPSCQKVVMDKIQRMDKEYYRVYLSVESLKIIDTTQHDYPLYIDSSGMLERLPLHRRQIAFIYTTKGKIDSTRYFNAENIEELKL